MKSQTYGFAVCFAILIVVSALAVIGGVKALTYHKTTPTEIRQAVKADPGTNLDKLAIQTAYSLAEQGNFHIKSIKVAKVKINGDRAVVTLKVVTIEGGPVTLAVSYVRGVWAYTGAVQV